MLSILLDGAFQLYNAELWPRYKPTDYMDKTRIALTSRERDILRLIGEGKTSLQIADILSLSLPTIKWYRKRLKSKFDAATTYEIVRRAVQEGLI